MKVLKWFEMKKAWVSSSMHSTGNMAAKYSSSVHSMHVRVVAVSQMDVKHDRDEK